MVDFNVLKLQGLQKMKKNEEIWNDVKFDQFNHIIIMTDVKGCSEIYVGWYDMWSSHGEIETKLGSYSQDFKQAKVDGSGQH